jgi:hypothetical protein
MEGGGGECWEERELGEYGRGVPVKGDPQNGPVSGCH